MFNLILESEFFEQHSHVTQYIAVDNMNSSEVITISTKLIVEVLTLYKKTKS